MQDTSSLIEIVVIKGEVQSTQLIKLDLSIEQFEYIEETLIQTYQRRIYHRDYAKKQRGDIKNISVKPALLLYLHEPIDSTPSIYYENVQAALDKGRVSVILNLTQFLYIKTVLQRRYQERLRFKLKQQNKDTPSTRNVKRPPALLLEL
jgi:hypothetical protein